MRKLLATALVSSVFASAALASGPTVPVDPPVAPPQHAPYNWGGAYAGAGLAYANASQTTTIDPFFPDASGGMFSGFVGYNWQRGSMVYGAEIVGNLGSLTATDTPCVSFPGANCTTTVDNFVALRGRVGVVRDRTLLFATAGFAADTRTYTRTGLSVAQRFRGGVVGVGVEHALGTGDWTMRGDLEYYFFGQETFGGATFQPNATVARMSIVRRF